MWNDLQFIRSQLRIAQYSQIENVIILGSDRVRELDRGLRIIPVLVLLACKFQLYDVWMYSFVDYYRNQLDWINLIILMRLKCQTHFVLLARHFRSSIVWLLYFRLFLLSSYGNYFCKYASIRIEPSLFLNFILTQTVYFRNNFNWWLVLLFIYYIHY